MIEHRGDGQLVEVQHGLSIELQGATHLKEITEHAIALCGKPVCYLTLADKEHTSISTNRNATIDFSPARSSFCRLCLQAGAPLVVTDAANDPRFIDAPFLREHPGVLFYAGAAITVGGKPVGTLCLLDVAPHTLSDMQQHTLQLLASQAGYLLELELTRKKLRAKEEEITHRNTALGKIAHMQSHEIRSPLAIMLGLLHLVDEEVQEVDEEWLSTMKEAANRLDMKIRSIVNETLPDMDLRMFQFHRVVEDVEDYAIVILDIDGSVENWNKGARKMMGYRENEILKKSFSNFYPFSDQKQGFPTQLILHATERGVAKHEGWLVRKDGSSFWARVIINAVYNDRGELIGFINVTRDLSELKDKQETLSIVEERSRRIIDEVDDYAIILLDEEGYIEKWNRGARRIKGYSGSEIIGKHFSIFYAEEDINKMVPLALLEEARNNARARHEGWRVRKDGTMFWGSVVITAIYNSDGKVIGFVKITKDPGSVKVVAGKPGTNALSS